MENAILGFNQFNLTESPKELMYVDGDILKLAEQGMFDYVVQGCNCFNAMAGGIALQIAKKYPSAVVADNETKVGDPDKLGTFTTAKCGSFTIINAYTQFKPGRDVNYKAIDDVTRILGKMYKNKKIACPMIGAGIAGGDWNRIEQILIKNIPNIVVVRYVP